MEVHMLDTALIKRISDAVEEHRGEIIAFTRALIRMPTVNAPPRGNEGPAQEFLAARLQRIGLEIDLFSLDEVKGLSSHPGYRVGGSNGVPRDYSGRPDLVAVWRGMGMGRSLILTGHIDVVDPGDPQNWRYGPCSATLAKGRIYGVGAVDAKGPLVAAIMAVECLREMGIHLQGDLQIHSFVDEEYGGGNGALATIARGYWADGAIMLEPSNLSVCSVTPGCQSVRVTVTGKPAHGLERWRGIEAVKLGVEIYHAFRALEEKRNRRGKEVPLFRDAEISAPLIVRSFKSKSPGGAMMSKEAEIEAWIMALPGDTQQSLADEIKEILAETFRDNPWMAGHPPQVEMLGRFLEPSALSLDHPLVRVLSAVHRTMTGQNECISLGITGDTYIYANYGGIPSVIMGPGMICRAHAPNEYITVEELIQATKVFAAAILAWCGTS